MTSAKRMLDVAGAGFGLLLLWPLFIAIAVAIRSDGGPAVFRHRRVGQHGKPFDLLKFRTMRVDVPGHPITVGNDPRITGVGHFLRSTKLDETLQLVNVLRGDMSLVGPRPEVARCLDPNDATHKAILALKPGMTDPASLQLWYEAELLERADDPEAYYRTQLLPEKHRLSLEYAGRANICSDVLVIVRTLAGMCLRGGRRGHDPRHRRRLNRDHAARGAQRR